MTRKGRMWVGVTLLLVLLFNYAVIGVPLMRRSESMKERSRSILIKQVKGKGPFNSSEDEYLLEIFKKERASLGRRILILNCAAVSLGILIMSWTAFGLVTHKKK